MRSADLPVGAGLGSSAAFSVALAAALLKLQLEHFPPMPSEEGHLPPQSLRQAGSTAIRANTVMAQRSLGASVACFRPGDSVRSLIDGWAYAAECILHGKPSGLDNAVACAGDAMRLSKKGGHGALSFEPVEPFPSCTCCSQIRGYLGRRRPSSRASAHCMKQIHVSQHPSLRPWQRSPSRSWICAPRTKPQGIAKQLDLLVQMNHKLLAALQVSAPSLEEVVAIAQADEFNLPTKLTGRGRGLRIQRARYTELGRRYDAAGAQMPPEAGGEGLPLLYNGGWWSWRSLARRQRMRRWR